ncbi:MAG: DUF1553 domain-containing protein [Opitutales bacterium]|nr:DUF1553 domain-containing protein [Opitutales bacterium]
MIKGFNLAWVILLLVFPAQGETKEIWSLQPVQRPPVPKADASLAEIRDPIDAFVQGRLGAKQLKPSQKADRRVLIRRLYFDLHGLPPRPEAVEAFVVSNDPKAYEKLVDELLDSPHYGERFARHWLDIAHYADTHGFERDKLRPNAWHYRDYVIQSLNEDKPYDRFLQEQIAGDALWPDDKDAIVATGFLAAGPWDFVGQVETKSPILRRSARALDLDDMLTQVMTAATAMTINCARCHDHKLDGIPQEDYYRLTAVFAGLKREKRKISEPALKKFTAEKKRLGNAIDKAQFAIGELQGQGVDLADLVGGGNGFGSGRKGIGLDARTGKMQERNFGDLGNVKPGNYAKCSYAFIDGVFVPAEGETRISSTNLKATGLPTNGGKAWDMIRNGPVASQFSTKWGGVDYNKPGHSMIGLHANAGITFDLSAIREATGIKELRFNSVAGYGGRTTTPSAEFRVLLDSKLMAHKRLGRKDAAPIDFEIPQDARFLTLISTDGGNGYSHDQISFGDPRLVPANPPSLGATDRKRFEELRKEKARLEKQLAALGEPPEFYGVVSQSPPVVKVLYRGNPEAPKDEVTPGTLRWIKALGTDFGTNETPEADRRAALARWITNPKNPLTRRVIVNRLWQWHFGQGIVDTPSDFGFGGSTPSHPELLDWLAEELLTQKWSLKAIQRIILNSSVYRQVSNTTHGSKEDADNRLLWRQNPRRLDAESLRDAVLATSGKLNLQAGGPGFRDFKYIEAYAPIYKYVTPDIPELWRRSIYRFVVRTTPHEFLTTLDCPDPANLTPKRLVTTTPLQALTLSNNPFMLKQTNYFAERLKQEVGEKPADQVRLGFALAFGRPPSKEEQRAAEITIRKKGVFALCHVLLNANEFVYLD